MNRRGGDRNDSNGGGARERSTNPGDGAPGRSGDAPSEVAVPRSRVPTHYGYVPSPRYGTGPRQPSNGNDSGRDTSPGISGSPSRDDSPGMSRPREYNGGGAVRRNNPGADSNNDNGDRDRGRRSGGDNDRGGRYSDGGGRRGGSDSDGGGSSAGSSRERSGSGSSGVSAPRHGGGSSDGGGSSAGRSSDRGDRGGSSAGRSSDGGSRSGGRSEGGGGGAVRRHPR
jgi:hypothetical protein